MFIRTASKRDLTQVSALLAETWHATYDLIYGAAGVIAISERWHTMGCAGLKPLGRKPATQWVDAMVLTRERPLA